MYPNDNECFYKAVAEWIKRDPENRRHKKLGQLNTGEFSDILKIAQDMKSNRDEGLKYDEANFGASLK